MKKLVVGMLAHVDAGKTTLSESMLYLSGKIRKLGRVDKQDAYLDTDELERARGITIFSKQAVFQIEHTEITILDTPGHVDFSAEMERTLQVLDYAILVISGADGVQGHTQTLWRLLKLHQIPVFLFVNKMDQKGTEKVALIKELKEHLSDRCIDFGQEKTKAFDEELAMCDESLIEAYLGQGHINTLQISKAIQERKVFPCFFGSALKLQGVQVLMQSLVKYARTFVYPKKFGAKVFKIARDQQGNRLTYMKITGGSLKVKDSLKNHIWEEKVNEIRIYSGEKYEFVTQAGAGQVCAVTGLTQTRPGEGLGIEENSNAPLLEPVLFYQILLPQGCKPRSILPKLYELEEEVPELRIVWNEALQEIQAQVMGEVQIEILQSMIKDRFDTEVIFDSGKIVYKETIGNQVEGVGHFEPLRHYAEVHLLLEAGELGSGMQFELGCSEDMLEKSWQRLVLSHLQERTHKGVLTGSAITDMKITLLAGRVHKTHTRGGDFREATYRAVRQGLKQAKSILLEPYYDFRLELPEKMVGRAMTDVEQMHGTSKILKVKGDQVILVGSCPVVTMRNYHQEVLAYTKGYGRLFCHVKGYKPCHNPEEVIALIGYDSEKDADHPTGSIFCRQGAGFSVSWDQVKDYMHIESQYQQKQALLPKKVPKGQDIPSSKRGMSLEEIDRLIKSTYSANQGRKPRWKKPKILGKNNDRPVRDIGKIKDKYLLVDGYNIIFAWPELKKIAKDNMDGARTQLLDYLSNYEGIRKWEMIVVFDAYGVKGQQVKVMDYGNIHVVYTKEAQTADHYIEKFVYDHHRKYAITVATSDALEQIIIRGKGAALLSARELKEEIEMAYEKELQKYREKQIIEGNFVMEDLLEGKINDKKSGS